ncbi:tRNA glutamyl-Q(34) synthetase GluQRS [Anaeroselena agilis]|uniref:Glutamyl-Q tRNA(Asp) synthetase n=1 Tax=Anaeroselena agilis TaxID=3063788 RepID=A0ABU3NY32_9FIRM|nr:tRNA glutamyl-Q(34) synthetase GluQRS [Selenomonadales bacterium 4137-cl]
MTDIRGRFAPSPSGQMHLGNAWTALLAWLQIRSLGGAVVLRVEDLDPDRSRPEYTAQIISDLAWLGLDWDEGPDIGGPYGPYRQDERRHLYAAALDTLAARGLVYPCYCTRAEIRAAASAPHAGDADAESAYPGTCRKRVGEGGFSGDRRPALRLIVPAETVAFTDGLHGPVAQNLTAACGDFIVRRADGVHAYQLAVVVDDAAMRITHVLRGDDLLASTPRQLYLYSLLGLTPPAFAHVPLLVSPDGHRLSKRQQDLALAALKERGVAAPEIIGRLAHLAGLIPAPEPVRPRDLVAAFSLAKLPREPVVIENNLFT